LDCDYLSPDNRGVDWEQQTAGLRIRIVGLWSKRWVRLATVAAAIPAVLFFFFATYYYVRFAHLIDARLHGERDTVFPRVLARPPARAPAGPGEAESPANRPPQRSRIRAPRPGGETGRVRDRHRRGGDRASRGGLARQDGPRRLPAAAAAGEECAAAADAAAS